jgi:nitrogen-specific signal transduction histidine kinase/CheY-like chemotaxis protein
VRDERGHLLCWEGTAEDITDRLRAAEEKAKLEDRLRQSHKIEAIGTLAGGIAHDFNNLLTPIIGYSQLAISNLPEVSPMRDDMVEILQVAERARDLVRQILVISRRDTGGTLAPVMFGPIIGEVLKLIGASIAPSIIIHFRVDPACGAVLGNASQLHQVVLNLCTNAVQAMEPDGGTLTVSLDHGCDGACPGRWVRLSVGDTGCGIPPQILPHIYEPYFTTKPSGRGSGLGLALVQGIVSSFGGEIRVSSDTGKGTVFDVYFPECEMVEQSVPNRGTMARGSGQRLLLVDDDRVVRKVLASLVRSLGYRPYECVSGADALEVFRSEPQAFDAVLTDYSMPGMSGLDLAHELHRLRPELPIIMGTGFADIDIKTDLTKNGITALIYKPYNIQILAESLLRIFPVAQPVQQAERLAL